MQAWAALMEWWSWLIAKGLRQLGAAWGRHIVRGSLGGFCHSKDRTKRLVSSASVSAAGGSEPRDELKGASLQA